MRGRKAAREEREQSAMEYFITYGWAVLIIILIFLALFQISTVAGTTTPFVCIGAPGFLCQSYVMTSSGAVIVTFGYTGSSPITIKGLGCNVTSPPKGPSVETQTFAISPGQTKQLIFQCPIPQSRVGTTIPVYLWIVYDTAGNQGLVQAYGKGILEVNYPTLLWNVTEWTPTDNAIDLLPFSDLLSSPDSPLGVTNTATTSWSSLVQGQGEGWSYSTDWHDNDVYNGIETIPFPAAPLNLDNAPCTGPPYAAHGYTVIAHTSMSGNYNIVTWSDDGTEVFYRNMAGGGWNDVFAGNAWVNQPPNFYANTITLVPGSYEFAVDYADTCDPAGVSMVLISPLPGTIS